MKKREFAVRLLFWLLPWPISKALPRSLRIYYFGPGAGPPPGFYNYWGVPKWFWEDIPSWEDFLENLPDEAPPWWPPNAPSWEDFLENLPDEQPAWWPIDPYNPPPIEDFPEPPAGPVNPGDPYTPGPGPVNPHPPIPSGVWVQCFDDTYWETKDQAEWNIDHWDFAGDFSVSIKEIGTWADAFRPTKMRITHDYGVGLILGVYGDGDPGDIFVGEVASGQEYDLDFVGSGDFNIKGIEHDAGETPCDFNITNIEFFS